MAGQARLQPSSWAACTACPLLKRCACASSTTILVLTPVVHTLQRHHSSVRRCAPTYASTATHSSPWSWHGTSQQHELGHVQVVRLLDGPVQEAPDMLNPYSEP